MTSHPPHSAAVEIPDGIPRDADALQVHLSLDQPTGEAVATLRDFYADHPDLFVDPTACIDQCNEYLEHTVVGCRICGTALASPYEQTCTTHRGDQS